MIDCPMQHHRQEELRSFLANHVVVAGEGLPDLAGGKGREAAGVQLNLFLEPKKIGRRYVRAPNRRVVNDYGTPGHPAKLAHQTGPRHTVGKQAEADYSVEGPLRKWERMKVGDLEP